MLHGDLASRAKSLATNGACGMCGSRAVACIAAFNAPPTGETNFCFPDYRRELWRCATCGHFENRHSFNLTRLYEGQYSRTTYGEQLRPNFERIMALPPERSDNRQRAAYIDAFWNSSVGSRPRDLADIGSGLGVFTAAMRERRWRCLAVDPDPLAARQARELGGAMALAGDFMQIDPPRRFPLLTFNKVLEHVPDMFAVLDRAKRWLTADAYLYVELPDGEAAMSDALGVEREEFFIEHYCAFSAASYALLASRSGFRLRCLDRVREPSGKYTLRGFFART